jgi:hypothetical protein
MSGFTPFASSVTLAPHSTFTAVFPEMQDGNFLYIEGTQFLSDAQGNPLSVSTQFRFGHQAPVPEPSGLTLFGLGTFSLLGYAWRRRKLAVA